MQPVFNIEKIKLIVGLGNPGKVYENTYHNVGHLFIDYLSRLSAIRCEMLKTDVFMNQSGGFVKKVLKKHNAKPAELLIVHDDSDLLLGKYKLAFGRGAAGHKGVESVIKALDTKNFWRLRIGIRKRNEEYHFPAGAFVLKKISSDDKKLLEEAFTNIMTSEVIGV